MNDELVKDFIKLHLDLMDVMSNYLPGCLKNDIQTIQKNYIEIAQKHMQEQEGDSKRTTEIPID